MGSSPEIQSPCGLKVAATFFQDGVGPPLATGISALVRAALRVAVTWSPAVPDTCASVVLSPGIIIQCSGGLSLKVPLATVTPSPCMVQPLSWIGTCLLCVAVPLASANHACSLALPE